MKTEQTAAAKLKNFTPLLDDIVKVDGVITAAVWGRMWRYAQAGEKKICSASVETIADELNLSVRTVIRHIQKLEKRGYLDDTTPDRRNAPHIYTLTDKARIEVEIAAVTESHTDDGGMSESHTGMTESHSGYDTESDPGMTESHLKKQIQIKKQLKIQQRTVLFANNEEAIKVYRDVAKYTPTGTDWTRAIELVRDVLRGHEDFGRDELVEYLKAYATDWTGRRTKEGKPYSIRNLVWLERAAAGEPLMPVEGQDQPPATAPNGGTYV